MIHYLCEDMLTSSLSISPYLIITFLSIGFSSFLDILKIWLRVTRTSHRFEEDEYEYKIIIKHDLGYKYSYFMKEVYRYIIQGRFKKSFHFKVTENTILIKRAK
jgi:hypothetical protein